MYSSCMSMDPISFFIFHVHNIWLCLSPDTNTECMSDIKVVPLLLNSLKWIQETDSLLAIVICIEALVENNGKLYMYMYMYMYMYNL